MSYKKKSGNTDYKDRYDGRGLRLEKKSANIVAMNIKMSRAHRQKKRTFEFPFQESSEVPFYL